MGLFDRFRKPKPSVPCPQLCYDVAYFILPQYAFNHLIRVEELCAKTPDAAGPFFYIMACQMSKVEPVADDARSFRWHHGQFPDGREYYVLEYPVPPSVDLSARTPEELMNAGSPLVLAPHFSAIIRDSLTGAISYHVLGQSPFGGGTTLRAVLPEGINCNLGPGSPPRLEAFLDALSSRDAHKG